MVSLRPRSLPRLLCFSALLMLPLVVSKAQEVFDPDPNSPTPVLLSEVGSTRALAAPAGTIVNIEKFPGQAFLPGSIVELFVTNLSLMPDEGANAFRIYAEDGRGFQYRFPVLDLRKIKGHDGVYGLTVKLADEIGYYKPPRANGDVLIRLTWRGLSSNRVRLGYGKIGGEIKDDPGAVPTPLPTAKTRFAKSLSVPASAAPEYVGYRWSGDRMRFMQQAGFGPTAALDQRLRRIGLRTYLAEQFDAPYPSATNPYPDLPLKNTDPNNATNGCGMFAAGTPELRACQRDYYSQYPVQSWFFREAFYGDAQLRHRVAWALSQIWVISGVDTQQSSHMIAYHKLLSQDAFANYRTLMKDMTLNPGMGNYLDMARSTKNNPNENYPREVMQLFTIGLFMLNQDGTQQKDAQGDPIPTYDQDRVNNFTKVFTGFSFCNTTCANSSPGLVNYKDPMILNQTNHDVTAKTLLSYPGAPNVNIPTNVNGATELDMVLDNIFNHPNVGPFVSRQLIQQLVTSDPSPAYVGRVAAVFSDNGLGVRGDMKAVIKAILLDPEARGDAKTDPNFGKLREPVQFVTNVARNLNVKSANLGTLSDGVMSGINGMGQNPFNSPTVFNYYPPDYVIPGTAINGPEYALMTTGTAIARANYMNTLVFGAIATSIDNPNGTALDISDIQALAAADTSGNLMLDELSRRMLNGNMSADMRAKILPAITAISGTDALGRARAAIYLVATSSQFQVQR